MDKNIELENRLKEILNEYAISVRNAMRSGRYREQQSRALKDIIKLIKTLVMLERI